MPHAMVKGSNILLEAAAVRAELRWTRGSTVPDIDASVLLVGLEGRVNSDEDFIFYNQPRHPSGLVRKLPKRGIGAALTDSIETELVRLSPAVDRLVLAASADGGDFSTVRDLRVQLYDVASVDGEPFAYFEIRPETGTETALICGEFYRRQGAWKFRALGQGYDTGLVGLATEFGIAVDEHAPEPEPPAPVREPAMAAPSPQPRPEGNGYPPAFTLPPQGPQFFRR